MSKMQKLQEKALRLELQMATNSLLDHLFPRFEESKKAPGRYHFLGHIIGRHSQLLQALLESNKARIQSEWSAVLRTYQSDVRFLHALSVMYWEAAQAKFIHQQEAEQEWIISTALWILLLSSNEFWDYFSQDRWTTEQGERLPLETRQQEDLMHDALEGILTLHSTYAKQSFAAGHYDQAKVHVRCLDMCRGKGKKLLSLLRTYGIPYAVQQDDQKLDWVTTQASKILDEWCVVLVAEAEKETNDADAIKQLPQGIRKNYEGGIRVLEPFIALNIPNVRVLSASLDWYNDWCYDVYVLKDKERLEKLVKAARVVADQLMPLCVKEQGYAQENQKVSQHFLLRGFVLDDPAQARKEYEEALAWNPANANAAELLEDASLEMYLKPAIEYRDKKEFAKAYQILDTAEQQIKDKLILQKVRASVCFQHAFALAEDGKFREALSRVRQACQLDQTEEDYQEFMETLKELAPEEDNIRLLKQAKEALDKERYDEVIQYASRVPSSSKRIEEAQVLLSVGHFKRGMNALERDNLEKAETDIRRALALCDDADARKTIKTVLAVTLNRRAVKALEFVTSRYEALSQAPKAKKLLEEALQLDPTNASARENLNMLRRLPSY